MAAAAPAPKPNAGDAASISLRLRAEARQQAAVALHAVGKADAAVTAAARTALDAAADAAPNANLIQLAASEWATATAESEIARRAADNATAAYEAWAAHERGHTAALLANQTRRKRRHASTPGRAQSLKPKAPRAAAGDMDAHVEPAAAGAGAGAAP